MDPPQDSLAFGPTSYPPATVSSFGRTSRYELLAKLASGGMATVYLARLHGAAGFWRLCAIKRPHDHVLEDPQARRSILQEAHLASLLHHPNVVPIIDVDEDLEGRLALVMDFVEGASLAELLQASTASGTRLSPRIGARIALDLCAGLQAAHELTDPAGEPLGLVHRDVSPQNVLVGVDGIARLADFGIAKHARSHPLTAAGTLKGKFSYMAPEYIRGNTVDARSDVFALGVVVWEMLTHRRLFAGDSTADTLRRVLEEPALPLSAAAPWAGSHFDPVFAAVLEKWPAARVDSARAFGEALEAAARAGDGVATCAEVGAAVRTLAAEALAAKHRLLRAAPLSDPHAPTRRFTAPRESVAEVAETSRPPALHPTLETTGAITVRIKAS